MIPSIRASLQLLLVLLISTLATAHSVARNPLTRLATVRNPTIQTQNYRVNALSTFDLTFDAFDTRIRLSLEPNHDVIAPGARVSYLGPDGEVEREEEIQRLDHKVFKGTAWRKDSADMWQLVGWARVFVRRDGVNPLFEGAFSINHNHHHIQMSSSYISTKNTLDPELDWSSAEDEFLVVWRDSDISKLNVHSELKRDLEDRLACGSDKLEFNMGEQNPLYVGSMMKREDSSVWNAPIGNMFSKRQIDSTPGSGNSAGVNLASTIGNPAGCPTTRKVALVGVATDCTYTGTFNSTQTTREHVITQMNTASNLYEHTFNISLGLQNLTISPSNCPGSPQQASPWNQPCSDNVNIQDRLNLFSAWRGTKDDDNSHWTLLTNCNSGSAVGLAWLGMACVNTAQTSNSSSGTETSSGANVVAKTPEEWQVIAHETGHTFGAVHDCTSQTCSDGTVTAQQCCPLSAKTCDAGEKYIMNPSTAEGITTFSPCTLGNICAAMGRNSVNTQCFKDNKGVTTISGQQCGNGIVEEGEECDCGGTEGCGDNACCDPTTCKFKSGAVCDDSNEDCCRSCQFASAGTVCRPSTGDCDPQETCPGNSPTCPSDITSPNGQSCGNGLTCASGQCTSRDQQCKTVMGSYTSGNDTYACDSYTCSLSCASPEFGQGVCYGLQQNFLDGTTCGGGGTCKNGQCKGSNVGKEIKSWIDDHKPLVIGICAGVGGLILLAILSCCWSSYRRRQRRRALARNKVVSGSSWMQPPPPWAQQLPPPYNQSRGSVMSGANGAPRGGGWNGPPPPAFQRTQSVRYA
ncbi:hypothetical protein NA57DRAFT_48643 [Rhizodiscina lignyota]|uniref:Disintegrin and metalloproteinase domain-containing protein B n=1 Tax=Rhizodiscina lignyota TaxID=1504668 RepID=A0A9P4M024_9PEZI|nr:hypothetical protein NA57DRAFT_48643 [Rhizodiscina lignyota]